MYSLELNNKRCIPCTGFGTWQIHFNSQAKNAVTQALKAGYRLVDTAKIYGNEKGVGKAIRESDILREDIFVTTKVWNSDQGYQETLQAFEESLNKLGLEYVDLYLIHWPATDKRGESWRALEEIYKNGRAKNIGVSNYTVRHLEELLGNAKIVPAVNQIEFHPFIYEQQKELLEFCNRHDIVVEAYSPLARGRRINDTGITQVAKRLNKSNAQIMLRWAIQHGTVPLPRSTNAEHIKNNYDVFHFEISDHDMAAIDALSDGKSTAWKNPAEMD